MNMVEKAIEVAAKAHEGQYRKSTNLPYISHPYAVGMILLKYGCSENVITAGILHDTVEDTNLTFDDIRREFNAEVEFLVRGASEENKEKSWEERKQLTISKLKTATKEVCMIVCADKLHNLRSIRRDIQENGNQVWARFKRGKDKQAWYYKEVATNLENQLKNEALYHELLTEMEQVFGN